MEEKPGPPKTPCKRKDGDSTQQLPSLLPPLFLHSSTTTLKGIMKRSHQVLGGRKQLSCEGKDSCYLLFKSGVTSGRRSMRKGNFQAERIWTLETFVQKWCLLVSYTLHGQTQPAVLGRLQKGPFSAAEQREAGGLGGA